ncbi:hypothetical protein GQ44DRAFT_821975 [Phaeosphaeriaceae sp. PMI808]|nr:hypothetical protein GQ44DRAFT_821975 [Phaeosphaeriaceae sp. PMI808]
MKCILTMKETQTYSVIDEHIFDDPSQLSQLLRQRAGSEKVLQFTASAESHQSGILSLTSIITIPQQQQHPVVHAPLFNALSKRRVATARNVKPSLPTHHSAPTSTVLIRDLEPVRKLYRSLGGMDAPGDTQPDSQMHKDYTSDIHGPGDSFSFAGNLGPKSLFIDHAEEDEGDSPFNDTDVVESSQDHQSPTPTSPTVLHDDDVLGAIPYEYALTSPFKFETPAIADRRRENSAQMLSSAMRTETTPGTVLSTSAFPGFSIGVSAPMSLTQAWQNTQAPTSPVQAEVSEDVAFTRPSPNFTHARHSSPIPTLSSPTKAMRDETPRTDPIIRSSSEPRADYISMKESQERHKQIALGQTLPTVEQDSWDEPSAYQICILKKKSKEDWERKAAISFAHISASPLLPERREKRVMNTRLSSSDTARLSRRAAKAHQNEDDATDASAQSLATNGQDHDLSPDQLSQSAPSSARAAVRHSKDHKVQVPKTSSHPIITQSGQSLQESSQKISPSSRLRRKSQAQALASEPVLKETLRRRNSRDSSAVMDSQPDTTADYESIPRPKSLRFPSSPSADQYSINQTTMATRTGYTSQIMSSSMPPMPPQSSPDEVEAAPDEDVTHEDEERVPSSPPMTTHEDDITYDEHEGAFDEYIDVALRDSSQGETDDEDVVMDEDNDLPLANSDSEQEGSASMKDVEMEDSEADLVQPRKFGLATDQEVSEILDMEATLPEVSEYPRSPLLTDEQRSEGQASTRPTRGERQATVPETDALEETQPSFFPGPESVVTRDHQSSVNAGNEPGTHNSTNNTEPFHTAQEQTLDSEPNQRHPASLREDGSDLIQTDNRLCSLQDIHNLPDTQPMIEAETEMPRLSGLDDNEEQNSLGTLSPVPPSVKRRRVTYGAKREIFRGPPKPKINSGTPSDFIRPAPVDDPPSASTQDREKQGAHAVVQAREEAQAPYTRQATLKSKVPPKTPKQRARRKGALKSVPRDLLQAMSSPANLTKPRSTAGSYTITPVTPTKRGKHDADLSMLDNDEERDELAGSTPTDNATIIQTVTDCGESPSGAIILPNRVFAAWPGKQYFPATCLGRVSSRQLQVRFDDSNTASIDSTQVRALVLYPGDHVKVDETGMKKHTYTVIGFKDKIDDLVGEEFPTTDCRGYTNVVLEEKFRDSLPNAKAVQTAGRITVPMGSIYLTSQLWTRLRDRSYKFSPPASPSKHTSRMGTPIISVDPTATPSFTRRGVAAPSLLKDVTTRATSVASSSARSGSGIFSNMAFVLTSTAADVDKETIAKVIKTRGGQVLEEGLHELFDYESTDARGSPSISEEPVGLLLKPPHKDLSFVALLSDSHSRSTKYIQALALNVPCLHLRWIQDSLTASRAVPFTKYLLPAGVSKFLDPNGVVRSRTMTPYDPSADTLSFAQTITSRDLLLHSQAVLLITGKSKKEIEKRQPFIFLTHALGSSIVGRCPDLATAAQLLRDGTWDWIYVDNGEQGVADAAAELFGTRKMASSGKGKKGKKRRRDEGEEREELVVRGSVGGRWSGLRVRSL